NSMVTPSTVYDYDVASGTLTVLKQQPVLPSPSGTPFSSGDYEQYREWAVAPDGTRVPISLVCRKGTPRDGSAPCLLYGYGSYEHSIDPTFSIPRALLPAPHRPDVLDLPAVAARPRLRLRDRARPRRGRTGPPVVHPREDAGEEEHVHRLRRLRRAPGGHGLD